MNLQFVQGDSIFARINKVPRQFSYLDKDIETDVIIVVGGVTGSILGYYLSKNNIKSVILEKNIVGYGSTSITTALLQYELDSTLRELEEYTSYDAIIKSYRLGIEALGEIKKFVKEHGNNFDCIERDTLLYTAKNSDIAQIR
ncbi:FAD dependent oxidoreductase [Clostridium sp. DSM 8431]|nr:FAD dependent oxidoreductase [Clostridium sp. DSM 8431]